MPFNLNKAVEYNEEDSPIISTTSFNVSTAQSIPDKPDPKKESGIISKVLRSIFKGSVLEQLQTQQYLASKIDDGTIPNEKGRQPNETMAEFEARYKPVQDKMNEVLSQREEDIRQEGLGRILEDPMTLGMASAGISAPIDTAVTVGAFTLKDHIFNARQFVEDKYPNASGNLKEIVELIDFGLTGLAIGGGLHKTKSYIEKPQAMFKKAVYERLNNLRLPTNVAIMPEHIAALQKNGLLKSIETLGIEKKHIEASLSNNVPIKVPISNMIDLSQTKEWAKTKGVLEDVSRETLVKEGLQRTENKITTQEPFQGNIVQPESNLQGKQGIVEAVSGDKTRGLSKSVEKTAIEKGLIEDLGDLPTYQARNMKEIASKVESFINENPDLAKNIALGEAPEQGGIRSQEMFTGLRIKAEQEGDINMIRDLALSETASGMATELGQRIKALDSGNLTDSPIKAIQELQRAREQKYLRDLEISRQRSKTGRIVEKMGKSIEKQLSPKEIKAEKNNIVKEIKSEIKRNAPTKRDWNSFIKSLEC